MFPFITFYERARYTFILNPFLPASLSESDLATSFLRVPYNDLLYADYSETDLLNINIRFDIYS